MATVEPVVMTGWIGVDFDGTLAVYNGFKGPTVLGQPVPKMRERVVSWLRDGIDVRIMTARVSSDGTPFRDKQALQARRAIELWCEQYLGVILPVTCSKDWAMIELWDDRCIQIETNTGRRMDGSNG